MFVIKYKKIFIAISLILVILSLVSISVLGINVGIDFKGGAITEVQYGGVAPTQEELISLMGNLGLESVIVQPTGDSGYIIKTEDLSDNKHRELIDIISTEDGDLVEIGFNSVGPVVGQELARKAIVAVVLVSIAIIMFIAFAFRKVSKPVSSWKYGFIAIAALLHDVIIPVGVYTVLSYLYGAEVNSLFVVAALTIIGLSVADTIVIFDRVRENLKKESNVARVDFREIVGKSLTQSYMRSIATSLTSMLVVTSLIIWGPDSTKFFAIMLVTGMFFGTYSSVFLASPLLVLTKEMQDKKA